MADRRIIVVAGMHRSGTSAMTRGLQALGVNLGEQLLPAALNDNEKGFFEDIEVNQLNIDLLHALDSNWDAFPAIPAHVFCQERLEPYRVRAAHIIADKMVGDRPLGLKDPRMARLLPFWQSAFAHNKAEVSYVIAVRNPMSVAQSLMRRDGFAYEKSYFLWLGHIVPAVLNTRGFRRVVVSFDLLISDPYAQLHRTAHALGLPYDSGSPGVREYAGDFLDATLRHAECDLKDLRADSAAPLDVISTYEMLLRLALDEVSVDAREVEELFMRVQANLDNFRAAFNYMVRSDRTIVEHDEHIARIQQERDRQIAERDCQIAERDARIHQLLNSRSWKVTRPLRAMTHFVRSLTGQPGQDGT